QVCGNAIRCAQGHRVQNAACYRDQVRRENEPVEGRAGQLRNHLWSVAMLQYAISADVFTHFAEMRFCLWLPAGSGDARLAIHDNCAHRIDRISLVQWYER